MPVTRGSLLETEWWNEPLQIASRATTGGSTSASTFDGSTSPEKSPNRLRWESPQRRLPEKAATEVRGWKHSLTQGTAVAVALMSGMVIGSVLVTVVTLGRAGRGPALRPAGSRPVPYDLPTPPSEVPPAYLSSPPLDNSCLLPQLAIPDGPRTFDACGFVLQSTDAIWNSRVDVNAAIDKYFHEEYIDAGSWGRRVVGKKALREAILFQMRAFPDIRIHITDCSCKGNDNDGYKCAMPDILTGTNLGPSYYGPPTGRYAQWSGMVQSFVKRDPQTGQWQYYAEWGVHDEWSLIQQLGLDFARVPHPAVNSEALHDCIPFLRFRPAPGMDPNDEAIQEAHIKAAKK